MDEKLSQEELEFLIRYIFDKLRDSMAESQALREMLVDQKDIDETELELRIADIKREESMRLRAWQKASDVVKGFRGGSLQ